jgi:hypothetical protein
MLIFFSGLAISLIYGVLGSVLLLYLGGSSEAQAFFKAYTISFKTIISLGLIIGTALIVFRTQNVIPKTIEAAFGGEPSKDYHYYKGRFESLPISIRFSTWFIIAGFIIFPLCQFPLSMKGQALMIIAACTEYALGVYVGRKLIYTGMMMHSLLSVPVKRNLFRRRELAIINPFVNVASTLTVIFVYIHVSSYYQGPFLYGSPVGQSIKLFLLLPAIIATPVLLIFNFYPREVLRNLYNRSIELEIEKLKQILKNEALSSYEKRSHLIEFKRMSREELNYGLKLTLSDLPIGITILIMVLEPLLKR